MSWGSAGRVPSDGGIVGLFRLFRDSAHISEVFLKDSEACWKLSLAISESRASNLACLGRVWSLRCATPDSKLDLHAHDKREACNVFDDVF